MPQSGNYSTRGREKHAYVGKVAKQGCICVERSTRRIPVPGSICIVMSDQRLGEETLMIFAVKGWVCGSFNACNGDPGVFDRISEEDVMERDLRYGKN
jgi:hypothetical protein